jgi:hypothetical protein
LFIHIFIACDLLYLILGEDFISYERPYVVHVTNLPLRVTSEEVAEVFQVPIAVILVHPCFRLEQSRDDHLVKLG